MELPFALLQKIVKFLQSIPNIHDSRSKQALLFSAGLDEQLQNLIPVTGASAEFVQLLVSTLKDYGALRDGRNALEAILGAAKEYVGQDRQAYCDRLIQELRRIRYSVHLPSQQEDTPKYDIFISYAREDGAWVRRNLYEPLFQCIIEDTNQRPKFFLDTSDLGIKQGENFLTALGQAIQRTKKMIFVFSKIYFQKEITNWELTKALQLDPMGTKGLINPILISPDAEADIPFEVNHINYFDVEKTPDWFERLKQHMGLKMLGQKLELIFQQDITDTIINITLPPIQVALSNWEHSRRSFEEEIEIFAQNAELQGTLKRKTSGGVAEFSDLSFKTKADNVRLVAKASGYSLAFSNKFKILEPPPKPSPEPLLTDSPPDQQPEHEVVASIPESKDADAYFFDTGKALAVISPTRVAVYDLSGKKLCEIPLKKRIRFTRRKGSFFVIADWSGNILVLTDDGGYCEYSFSDKNPEFFIPGDCAISGENIFVGFWNGNIYHLSLSGGAMLILNHPAGIQALENYGTSLYICDLNGGFHIYQNDACLFSEKIERSIARMRMFETRSIVIIGGKTAYQLSFGRSEIVDENLGLSDITFVQNSGEYLIVVNNEGKGVWLDEELVIQSRFHTTTGAYPLCADNSGKYCVFAYPQGMRTLLENDRIVYSHFSGSLSIDPSISHIALGDGESIKLYQGSFLTKIYQGNKNET